MRKLMAVAVVTSLTLFSCQGATAGEKKGDQERRHKHATSEDCLAAWSELARKMGHGERGKPGKPATTAVGTVKRHDKQERHARIDWKTIHAQVLAKLDENKDGRASSGERRAAFSVFVAHLVPHQKGDRPGKQDQGNRQAQVLKRFDKDGDGKLNDDERQAARAAFGNQKKQRGPQGGGDKGNRQAQVLKRFDKDGDGKLNDDERQAARAAFGNQKKQRGPQGGGDKGNRQAPGQGREQVLKRFDKDGDGKLNDEERQAAKKALQERGGKRQKD